MRTRTRTIGGHADTQTNVDIYTTGHAMGCNRQRAIGRIRGRIRIRARTLVRMDGGRSSMRSAAWCEHVQQREQHMHAYVAEKPHSICTCVDVQCAHQRHVYVQQVTDPITSARILH